jgi:glutaredoxin 3
MEIKIYSKHNCIFCDKAKMRLAKYNPTVLMLDEDFTREEFFKLFPNAKTFPQIVMDGKSVGGYMDLNELSV